MHLLKLLLAHMLNNSSCCAPAIFSTILANCFRILNTIHSIRITNWSISYMICKNCVKGSAENSRQINRKFGVELLGNSFANLYRSIDNISNFAWVYKEMFWDENSGSLLYQNSTLMFFENQKFPKISDLNLAQHISIDYV